MNTATQSLRSRTGKKAVFLAAWLCATAGFSYEVWMGTSCTPANAAVYPQSWSNTAAQVTGLNINRAPCLPDPGTPCENETSPSTAQWKTIFNQIQHADGSFSPIPRSAFDSDRHPETTLEQIIDGKFEDAATFGYTLGNIMIYDNAVGTNSYSWTVAEVQQIRDYLDANGHAEVGLMWNARNNSLANKNWCKNALIDAVLLEAEPGKWFDNVGSRQDLLKFLWTNELTSAKELVFQVPISGSEPYGNPDGFQQMRRMVRWLGNDLMGWEFNRSPRVIFMPVTYNYPTYTFYPETEAPDLYGNTLTSLVLSLIEQRDLFEGRSGIPTEADADSKVRNFNNPPPVLGSVPAVAAGSIYSNATWTGGVVPQPGDTNAWQTAGYALTSEGTNTFAGLSFVVQVGGSLTPKLSSVTTFNTLVLEGGQIHYNNNLSGTVKAATIELNAGSLKSGNATTGRSLVFNSGALAGSGRIDILGNTSASGAGVVRFENGIDTSAFTGVFDVHGNGTLDLSPIPTNKASFGIRLSGSGRYYNDANVAVATLEIDGIPVDAGTYAYTNFSASQQSFLVKTSGTITVLSDPYTAWAHARAVVGGKTDDDDDDGLLNLAEYALGGNPTNSADRGHLPVIETGSDWIDYIHVRHAAKSAVRYTVEVADDLVAAEWTTNGVEVVGIGVLDAEFNSVTNRISTETEAAQFIRLLLE